jgi:hypothetical protein
MEISGEKSSEMNSEFREFKGWTDIKNQTMCEVEWGLLDSMKLYIK